MKSVLLAPLFACAAFCAQAETVRFGDNTSEYANDGECDDRRFFGAGMSSGLDNDHTGHDARDCRRHYKAGNIKLWNETKARAATNCGRIDFGDNSSEWANDNECDDPRFEGRQSSGVVISDDIKKDASDCRSACRLGTVFIRNY